MDRVSFGRLVAALRKEQFNYQSGRSWSQQKLADRTGLTQRIVSKIEAGKQRGIDGVTLVALANAFGLTSLERSEFFAMASEIGDGQIARSEQSDEEVFAQMWASLSNLHAPAMLVDSYGDVLGVNRSLTAFHNLRAIDLQARTNTDAGVNILSMLLAHAGLRQALGNGWRRTALACMRQWRVTTLRHRLTHRYERLFESLATLPDFRTLWVAGYDSEEASYEGVHLRSSTYRHAAHGLVSYSVFTSIGLCTCGELYLSVFVPQDFATATLFQEVGSQNKGPLPLMPWPHGFSRQQG